METKKEKIVEQNEPALIKEILPVVSQAQEMLKITNKDELTSAIDLLSKLNRYSDALTEDKEKITKPLNEALKVIRAKYKPVELKLEEAIASIRKSMSTYQSYILSEQKKQEEKIVNKVANGTLKVETGIKKLEAVEKADKSIITNEGSIKFIATKKFEVMDITLLPLEYHLANDTMIRQAMKDNIELAGVRYWIEQVPRNSR